MKNQLSKKETSNLTIINLYNSAPRIRETSRNLSKRLEDLEIGKGFQLIGLGNIIYLREMVSKVNTDLSSKNLSTKPRYKQLVDGPKLNYIIIRKQ